MSIHQQLADATFQIVAGNSRGSGFSFVRPDLVVTNFHVVQEIIDVKKSEAKMPATVITESGERILAKFVGVNQHNDIAILQLTKPLPKGRVVLQPSTCFTRKRGEKLIFSGYPHGMPQLLTSEAIVSAPLEHGAFALDGMVNGGNSGGPIVDANNCQVVGIVTQRRYVGAEEVDAIAENAIILRDEIKKSVGKMIIGGIDYAKLNEKYAESLSLLSELLVLNANSGIGIGLSIQPVVNLLSELGSKKII